MSEYQAVESVLYYSVSVCVTAEYLQNFDNRKQRPHVGKSLNERSTSVCSSREKKRKPHHHRSRMKLFGVHQQTECFHQVFLAANRHSRLHHPIRIILVLTCAGAWEELGCACAFACRYTEVKIQNSFSNVYHVSKCMAQQGTETGNRLLSAVYSLTESHSLMWAVILHYKDGNTENPHSVFVHIRPAHLNLLRGIEQRFVECGILQAMSNGVTRDPLVTVACAARLDSGNEHVVGENNTNPR
jgi:predicted metal-binding protein